METDMQKLLEKTLSRAKAQGADQVDLILTRGKKLALKSQEGKIEKYDVSGSHTLGVRVIKDERVGISYTEDFRDESIDFMIDSALTSSRYNEKSPFEEISTTNSLIHNKRELSETASVEKKIDFTIKLEANVKERDKRVQSSPYNGLSEITSETFYMNDCGSYCTDRDQFYSYSTSALMAEGDEKSTFYDGNYSRILNFEDITRLSNVCVEHAGNWLGASSVRTGSYDVIFDIDILESLMGCFGGVLSSKLVLEKKNPWQDKKGQAVMASHLSLIDTPFSEKSFFTYHFDSEGNQRKSLEIIKSGELLSFYHNSATAKEMGDKNTFHASRGPRGTLSVGGTNLVLSSDQTHNVKEGEYIELLSEQGLYSGANFSSGNFSFGASGYYCKDGKRIRPIKNFTVAGNYYQMLLSNNADSRQILLSTGGSLQAPLIKFNKLSIAGN